VLCEAFWLSPNGADRPEKKEQTSGQTFSRLAAGPSQKHSSSSARFSIAQLDVLQFRNSRLP